MDQEHRRIRKNAIITAAICIFVVITMFGSPILLLVLKSSVTPIIRKQKVFNLVKRNYEVIVDACESNDLEALSAIDGIKKVNFVDGYVLVFCQGYGFASETQHYGFYYSVDNLPVAVSNGKIICQSSQLVKEGKGFQFIDSYLNIFYTEHIKGNIYFYEESW